MKTLSQRTSLAQYENYATINDNCEVITSMVETEKVHILLVDDRLENLLAMESVLESPALNIVKVTSGNDALSVMIDREFAVVLLDV